MKIIVCGFAFNGSGSYIRSYWNMLDLFVVVIGVMVRSTACMLVNLLHVARV